MSGGMNTPGISHLTRVIRQAAKTTQSDDLLLDFGEIAADYSLHSNELTFSIPKSDYLICRSLFGVSDPEKKVKPGDRVLIAWVGSDAVVVDIIMEAEEVFDG